MRTSFESPWQNGVAERWVESCRRDLLDHIVAVNERHLKRLLSEYVRYHHEDRTHLGLGKRRPNGRIRSVASGQVVSQERRESNYGAWVAVVPRLTVVPWAAPCAATWTATGLLPTSPPFPIALPSLQEASPITKRNRTAGGSLHYYSDRNVGLADTRDGRQVGRSS